VGLVLAAAGLLFNLDLTTVEARKGTRTLKVTTYRMLGLLVEQRMLELEEGARLGIWELG
jgi:hypothetical protein